MRTKIIKKYKGLGDNYLAFDWAINLFLLEKGKINRSEKGLLTIGSNGMSSKKNYVKSYRNSLLDLFFPFKKLTIYLYKLTRKCSFKCKLKTLIFVLKLNAKVFYWELSKIILKN